MNPIEESEGEIHATSADELIAMGVTLRLDPKAPKLDGYRATGLPPSPAVVAHCLDFISKLVRGLAFERGKDPQEMWRELCLDAQVRASK